MTQFRPAIAPHEPTPNSHDGSGQRDYGGILFESTLRDPVSGQRSESTSYRGLRFETQTVDGAARELIERAQSRQGTVVVTPNLQILRGLSDEPALRAALGDARAYPDGRGAILLARAEGVKLGPRVAGSDLLPTVASTLASTANRDVAVVIAGKKPDKAISVLANRHPETIFLGVELGHAKVGEHLADELVSALPHSPAIVFVCLGYPKQESCSLAVRQQRPDVVLVGAGAAADMLAGDVRRAPVAVQRLALEWLWRLVTEPRRLWRRYLLGDIPFILRTGYRALRARVGVAGRRHTKLTQRRASNIDVSSPSGDADTC